MFHVNKKLWSFKFGCLLAVSFVWLSSLGGFVPVPEVLFSHPIFVHDYYSSLVSALSASLLSIMLIIVMRKGFNICTSEHTFWLVIPIIIISILAIWTGIDLYASLLYAALSSLCVIGITAKFYQNRKVKIA